MGVLRCPVRGCGEDLADTAGGAACARGHSFDRARAGYLSLLQPQDSRARAPGDSAETVAARRRVADSGLMAPLDEAIAGLLDGCGPHPAGARILDVGCGEGRVLRELCSRRPVEAWGLDLSAAAASAAARAQRDARFVVANADRGLPFTDSAFDVVLSVTARRPASEIRRVLRDAGRLLVVVPGPDDLRELRERVLGAAPALGAADPAAEMAPHFQQVARRRIVWRERVEPALLRDLAALTYRAGRASRSARAAHLEGGDVTLDQQLVLLSPTALRKC